MDQACYESQMLVVVAAVNSSTTTDYFAGHSSERTVIADYR